MAAVVIIRPSGVWNSRAPLHDYVFEHRKINRLYFSITLALREFIRDLQIQSKQTPRLRTLLKVTQEKRDANRGLQSYLASFDKAINVEAPTMIGDLENGVYFVRESIVARYSAVFETYVLCWCLNYLLAKLERGDGLTNSEQEIALKLSPLSSRRLPETWRVFDAFPDIKDGLRKLPHVKTDPVTKGVPIADNELNALAAIEFWRAFRNACVHRSRVVSKRFVTKYGALWERLRSPYAKFMGPMKVGQQLLLYDDTVRAVFTTHWLAARWLNDELVKIAGDRRGHPFAPDKRDETRVIPNPAPASQPLLLEGDHGPSYDWWLGSRITTT